MENRANLRLPPESKTVAGLSEGGGKGGKVARKALELRRRLYGERDVRTADAMNRLSKEGVEGEPIAAGRIGALLFSVPSNEPGLFLSACTSVCRCPRCRR